MRSVFAVLWLGLALGLASCDDGRSRPAAAGPGDFAEDFGAAELDLTRWARAEFVREIQSGALVSHLRGSNIDPGAQGGNNLSFRDPNRVNVIRADVTVQSASATGGGLVRARLGGVFYNSVTPTPSVLDSTGDVYAEISMTGTEVFFLVARCRDFDCLGLDPLTPGPGGRVPLGQLTLGSTHRLSVDWSTANANKFTFRLDGDTPVTFDPAAAGAAIVTATAGEPFKVIGTLASPLDAGESASIAATFDDVETEAAGPYDSFAGASIDPDRWLEGEVRLAVSGGKLTTTATQSFTGVADPLGVLPSALGQIVVNPNRALTRERIQADVRVKNLGIVNTGLNTPGVRARTFVQLAYQEQGFRGSSQDFFFVRVELRGTASGLSAALSAFGCADPGCLGIGYPILRGFQLFSTPVSVGGTHTVSVEHLGSGIFVGTIDNESLVVNLSSIPRFDPDSFQRAQIRGGQVQFANDPLETGALSTEYDNVIVGSPP